MEQMPSLHPYLQEQLLSGQLAHAHIFTGNLAREQALALCTALECTSPNPKGMPCGQCRSCRNVMAGVHPDIQWLEPEGSSHKVENMRRLVAAAGLSCLSGNYKVYIINQAEKMKAEAANTLLKLLEEPAPFTVLLLLTLHPEQLLSTIRSRCQISVFSSDTAISEPICPQEILDSAYDLLLRLPHMQLWEVLQESRDHMQDNDEAQMFLYALLQHIHAAVCGRLRIPMKHSSLLNSAALLERALESLSGNVNKKLLADVVYLRLRQNYSE